MKNGATTKVLRLQVLALTLIQREFDEVKTARDEHRRGTITQLSIIILRKLLLQNKAQAFFYSSNSR